MLHFGQKFYILLKKKFELRERDESDERESQERVARNKRKNRPDRKQQEQGVRIGHKASESVTRGLEEY